MENKNYFERFYLEQEVSTIVEHYKTLLQQLKETMRSNNQQLYLSTVGQIVKANELLIKRGIIVEVLQTVQQKLADQA